MTEQTMPDLKWTKKPVTIEAWQFTEEIALQYWENRTLPPFGCRSVSGEYKKNTKVVRDAYFHIDTLEGCMKASLGDWIIKGVKGEFYPCKPDIFEATYTRHDPTPKPAEGVTGETSDGYHTFNELYEHRHILFLAVLTANIDKAWRSKLHSDGTMFDDWFIAGLNTDAGQATYHLPMRIWELFKYIPELGRAPEWDGHTSNDVLVRIRDMAFFDGVKALQPAAQKTEGVVVGWQVYNPLVKAWTHFHENGPKIEQLKNEGYVLRPVYAALASRASETDTVPRSEYDAVCKDLERMHDALNEQANAPENNRASVDVDYEQEGDDWIEVCEAYDQHQIERDHSPIETGSERLFLHTILDFLASQNRLIKPKKD